MDLVAESEGMVITIDDVIPPFGPYCSWGARTWFRLHNLDFVQFMASGIPAEQLLATGDHMAVEVVTCKIRRLHGQ